MDALIYTAVSGADRSLRAQQVHANNLANMETGGFRANLEVSTTQSMAPFSYGYDSRHMSQTQSSAISARTGTIKETGRELDVAVAGDGYLTVASGDGEAYTRAGAMEVDANGALTINGNAVLGQGGPIVLPQYTSVAIGPDGTISVQVPDGVLMQTIDKLKLVKAPAGDLTKNEAGLVVARDGQQLPVDETVLVADRHLEGSNVSAVEEMVATMSLNRAFEMQMKLFQASDKMNETGNRLISG